MIRALCTWSLKISAALYVRHFHILHTIENHPQKAKQDSLLALLMNSNTSQRIENSQDRQESGTYPLILVNDIRSCILHLETPNIC